MQDVSQLPSSVLSLSLEKLEDAPGLTMACCVCRAFRDSGGACAAWQVFCSHWQHWDEPRYVELREAGSHKGMYALRLQVGSCAAEPIAESRGIRGSGRPRGKDVHMLRPSMQMEETVRSALQAVMFPTKRTDAISTLVAAGADAQVRSVALMRILALYDPSATGSCCT